jgi:Glyoxalase-like domain
MGDRPYFHSLVLDCAEPRKNADFYAELLAYEVVYADDEWVTIAGPGPMLSFQLALDHVATTWPDKDVPQQMHVDFFVSDIVTAHERVSTWAVAPSIRRTRRRRAPSAASACTPTRLGTRSASAGRRRPPGRSQGTSAAQ